jgi:hypothetical protein
MRKWLVISCSLAAKRKPVRTGRSADVMSWILCLDMDMTLHFCDAVLYLQLEIPVLRVTLYFPYETVLKANISVTDMESGHKSLASCIKVVPVRATH